MNEAAAVRDAVVFLLRGNGTMQCPNDLADKGHTLTYEPHLVNDSARYQSTPLAINAQLCSTTTFRPRPARVGRSSIAEDALSCPSAMTIRGRDVRHHSAVISMYSPTWVATPIGASSVTRSRSPYRTVAREPHRAGSPPSTEGVDKGIYLDSCRAPSIEVAEIEGIRDDTCASLPEDLALSISDGLSLDQELQGNA